MPERRNIPSSNIPGSAACGQWETLLADALDGALAPESEGTFSGHMASCATCAALFEEARRGREWMEFLSPEPEIPEGLLERILAQTGPGQKGMVAAATAGGVEVPVNLLPAWHRPGFMGHVRRWAEPRLMMTVAMAFFSIALTLNLTGVKLNQIRLSDLRPTAIRSYMERRLTTASVPIIRYYDHLRFVYEVQTRMRELRGEGQQSQPQQNVNPAPGESRQNQKKDGGSRAIPPFQTPPQQSVRPAPVNPDFMDVSLKINRKTHSIEQVHNGSTNQRVRERSRVWTA